jgi:SAM-dependent methyltransferase
VSYASLTHQDPNRIKRWLQNRRLADAIALLPAGVATVVDFGGGDGELCARLALARPGLSIVCFEPTAAIRAEAVARLQGLSNVHVVGDEAKVTNASADAVFCNEVFEHLPPAQTDAALSHIERMLKPGGLLIAGVPIETGPPALAKGLFRMVRRLGAHDGRPQGILKATFGLPPGPRVVAEIESGRPYHPAHLGFDHRRFARGLGGRFEILRWRRSPVGWAPAALSSEIYLVARRLQHGH